MAAEGEVSYIAPAGPLSLINLGVLLILPFVLVDAAMAQFQMLLTGGSAPITPALLKVALLAAIATRALLRGKIRDKAATHAALIFIAYLVPAALYQYFELNIPFADILLSYNAYYLLPLVGALALASPLNIPDRILIRLLIALSLVCGALGIAQYVTNSPIVRTDSSDGNFHVLVWSTFGHIRVFSLFIEPATCALFFCLIASLAIAMCNRRKNLVVAIPLLVLSLFTAWASGARTNIACTVCGVVASCVITFGRKKNRTRWLPLLWLAAGLLPCRLRVFTSRRRRLVHRRNHGCHLFFRTFRHLVALLDLLVSTSVWNLLFGNGMVQGRSLDQTGTGTGGSDNLYLAIILHVGLIGLSLMLFLLWHLWNLVRKEAETMRSYLTTAVAAAYSTVLLAALFTINFFGVIFVIFALSEGGRRPAASLDEYSHRDCDETALAPG